MHHKPHSKKTKERISQSLKGRKRPQFSERWKRKISEAHKKSGHKPPSRKGMRHSEETKEKIRLATEGRHSWNKGRKWPQEVIEKFRQASLGRKLSEESRKKISSAKLGKNNPNWKGGISSSNQVIRRSLEYKLWREAVFKRDNYVCIWCGARSKKGKSAYLNVDHIKPFADYPELRFAIDNGRTLCMDCHKKTDTFGWKQYNKKYKAHG